MGSVEAGLDVGSPLRADASAGTSGVFVNGRELHSLEIVALQRITAVLPGRYWVDAAGNGGFEGGPALWNIHQLAAAKNQQAQQSRPGGAWSYNKNGIRVVGDGNGWVYYNGPGGSWDSN
jgi:hypothetical protein